MRPHALFGKENHDLVELATGRADIVIFDHLGQINDLHLIRLLDTISIQNRQDQIQSQRGTAAHSAAGNIAVQDRINTLCDGVSFAFEDMVNTIRKPRPCIIDLCGLWFGRIANPKLDNAVIRKITAEQPHFVSAIGFIRHPDKPVRPDAEQLGAVIVAMFNAQTKPR